MVFSVIVLVLNAICAYFSITRGLPFVAFVNGTGVMASVNWIIQNLGVKNGS